ncbi:M20/M25/M40 family metallo-hydrolase [Turicimonas muris]|uniref:M20/M25/M40 family metallo-hydrolase n=4 Tax=Turicimonas muris TaxID=1796652 RepID=UPI00080EEDB6|nr:M20/M25/M40 family metallo-hydrolase [Turicimonas muris]QQQ97348.1 M20/M25/M40 family metallo-hydrolase [Turicimonas muris]
MNQKLALEDEILLLTKHLCAIASVSTDAGKENECAEFIFNYLSSIQPVSPLTIEVDLIPCEKDPWNRKAVLGLLSSPDSQGRTVILTGHFDVVSTDVCGELKSQAFEPDLYTKLLQARSLNPEAKRDLDSGNWLFGRGVMDMKGGLALFLAIFKEYAESGCGVNLLFLAVPDEENSSAGMRGTIRKLNSFIKEKKLDVIAAFTGEPCFRTTPNASGQSFRPYYTGTTGKIMPFFYCVGKAAHVNDYFQGLSSVLLASEIVTKMEANPAFLEGQGNWLLSPPACLGFEIRRNGYSVTLPERAVCYFNLLTIEKTPQEILSLCVGLAQDAASSTLETLKTSEGTFIRRGGTSSPLPKIKVLSYSELLNKVRSQFKDDKTFDRALKKELSSRQDSFDEREQAIRIMEAIISLSHSSEPQIVVGFLPPYYPPRINKRRNEKESRIKDLIHEVIAKSNHLACDSDSTFIEVFGGITDLSYLGYEGDPKDLQFIAENLPGWGETFWIPIQELTELSIPIANLGPSGKDAHKMTERLELDYSLRTAPELLRFAIKKLSKLQ